MRILIGMLTYDRRVDMEIARTIIELEREKKHDFDYIFPVSSHISRGRNMVIHEALKEGHDAVLFWDSDIGISDAGFADKLLETSYKFDAGIVGGAYRMKKPNNELIYVATEEIGVDKKDNIRSQIKEPRLVYAVGTGIMLIHRAVYEKIFDPWFTIVDKPLLEVEPEDFYFCEMAQNAGIKVAIDPRFETRHYGSAAWIHHPNGVK